MIVPMKPVIALKGISALVNVLDNISTTIIKPAPKLIHKGIVCLVFLPTNCLTICGITNPTQLIVPQNATDKAVSKVDITIIKNLYNL